MAGARSDRIMVIVGAKENGMTKRQYIAKRVQGVMQVSGMISLPTIALIIFAQVKGLDARTFWICVYTFLGTASLCLLAWMLTRTRCPDCGYNIWLEYLRVPMNGKSMTERIASCPKCHSDFGAEMEVK